MLAYENKAVGLHAVVDLKYEGAWIKKTTLGRVIFNSIVPKEVRFINQTVGKRTLRKSLIMLTCYQVTLKQLNFWMS